MAPKSSAFKRLVELTLTVFPGKGPSLRSERTPGSPQIPNELELPVVRRGEGLRSGGQACEGGTAPQILAIADLGRARLLPDSNVGD